VTARTVAKDAKAPREKVEAPATSARQARLTFKDKHALETLPATIAALRADAAKLQLKLDDPQYYARDRAAFEQTSTALGDVQRRIEAAETQWLELEILREEIASE